jgi:hypothetical protein
MWALLVARDNVIAMNRRKGCADHAMARWSAASAPMRQGRTDVCDGRTTRPNEFTAYYVFT